MKRFITIGTTVALVLSLAPVAQADQTVICESKGHDHHYCPANTSGGVTLVNQRSHSGCWQNDTWGFDKSGIWVSNGCRAEFRVGTGGPDWARSLEQQYGSGTDTWNNSNQMNQWVDQQVDGVFKEDNKKHKSNAGAVIGAALAVGVIAALANQSSKHDSNNSDNWGRQDNWGHQTVTCESHNNQNHYCRVGWSQHVELQRQLSRAPCQYNRTWGYDRNGIWVSNGCRGVFSIDGNNNSSWSSGSSWSTASSGGGWNDSGPGVTLYRDVSFRGSSQIFSHDVADLSGSRIGNDAASSARISRGCRARLFQHANYQGSWEEVTWDNSDLRGSHVGNDQVSSIRVRCN